MAVSGLIKPNLNHAAGAAVVWGASSNLSWWAWALVLAQCLIAKEMTNLASASLLSTQAEEKKKEHHKNAGNPTLH